VNDESDLHQPKHSKHRISTKAGRQIDCNDEHRENARLSTTRNWEPASKPNEESEVHQKKQSLLKTSIEAGIEADFNEKQRQSAPDSI
jgi:hypothetical protein